MTTEQRNWCLTAMRLGGSFVKLFAQAILAADDDNERILLPVLRTMMEKYPSYSDRRMQERAL